MNRNIVEYYGTRANCNIAKEEIAKLIYAISKWERVNGIGYKTDTTREDALENLTQAMADCQNALDSLAYALKLDKDTIQQKIKEVDERIAKQLYGRNVL